MDQVFAVHKDYNAVQYDITLHYEKLRDEMSGMAMEEDDYHTGAAGFSGVATELGDILKKLSMEHIGGAMVGMEDYESSLPDQKRVCDRMIGDF